MPQKAIPFPKNWNIAQVFEQRWLTAIWLKSIFSSRKENYELTQYMQRKVVEQKADWSYWFFSLDHIFQYHSNNIKNRRKRQNLTFLQTIPLNNNKILELTQENTWMFSEVDNWRWRWQGDGRKEASGRWGDRTVMRQWGDDGKARAMVTTGQWGRRWWWGDTWARVPLIMGHLIGAILMIGQP